MLYKLVTVPAYGMMYVPDGKTLISKTPTETSVWAIKGAQGSRWTTVNTAIRFVLERRDETHDALIKKNADETLRILKVWSAFTARTSGASTRRGIWQQLPLRNELTSRQSFSAFQN